MKKNNFKIVELKPSKNKSSVKRTVFIKDFIIQEIIGIHRNQQNHVKFMELKKKVQRFIENHGNPQEFIEIHRNSLGIIEIHMN